MNFITNLLQPKRLEDKCIDAKIDMSHYAREIRPYKACEYCPHYLEIGSKKLCFNQDYVHKIYE